MHESTTSPTSAVRTRSVTAALGSTGIHRYDSLRTKLWSCHSRQPAPGFVEPLEYIGGRGRYCLEMSAAGLVL